MTKKIVAMVEGRIENLICEIRGQKVMLDSDLARVYGVSTKRLNEQVRRNIGRFPADFVFRLTKSECDSLRPQLAALNRTTANRSQIATGSQKHRDPKFRPYVFTEHGAIMASNVLRSPRALQMSVFVVRAFVRMRGALTDTRTLAKKLAALEKELKGRLDIHESAIVTVLQRVMDIIDPPPLPVPKRRKLGF